jgi:mRNA interferase RelE/StbE
VVDRIVSLAEEPRPPGPEKLAGHEDRFRVRQGKYRIVCSKDDRTREVVIVKVGHHRDVYRPVARRST